MQGSKVVTPVNKVSFDFRAKYFVSEKVMIEVNCSLFNSNRDTIYFLSSTCDGLQYSLRYDTSKFLMIPTLNCFSDFPAIAKIPPSGRIDFKSHFRLLKNDKEIKLDFIFRKVDENFDITGLTVGDIYNDKKVNNGALVVGPERRFSK